MDSFEEVIEEVQESGGKLSSSGKTFDVAAVGDLVHEVKYLVIWIEVDKS